MIAPGNNSPIVATTREELRKIKQLAERAVAQLDGHQLWTRLDPGSNSVGVLMRHIAGNMRSRWTDFRTTDGEKPDRRRDAEFEDAALTREELLAEWNEGWQRVFDALDGLDDANLQEIVFIRGEPHTIYRALVRQLAHYAGHAYQIVAIARHLKGPAWQTLSIPRGGSEEFTRQTRGRHRTDT
jgi:hypothetical protein